MIYRQINNTEKMNELLIKKYLEGKATEEEEKLVLDYVSEDDARLCELLSIADEIRKDAMKKKAQESRKKRLFAYRTAASVAILLIVGATWFGISNRQNQEEMYAYNNTPEEQEESEYYEYQEPIPAAPVCDKPMDDPHQVTPPSQKKADVYAEEITTTDTINDLYESDYPSETFSITPIHRSFNKSRIASARSGGQHRPSSKSCNKNHIFECSIPSVWSGNGDLIINLKTNADRVRVDVKYSNLLPYNVEYEGPSSTIRIPAYLKKDFKEEDSVVMCYCTGYFSHGDQCKGFIIDSTLIKIVK